MRGAAQSPSHQEEHRPAPGHSPAWFPLLEGEGMTGRQGWLACGWEGKCPSKGTGVGRSNRRLKDQHSHQARTSG